MELNTYKEIAEGMEKQLITLYEEKARFGDPEQLHSMLKSFEDQLASIYSEREGGSSDITELRSMVSNLEENVVALIEDKTDLEKKLSDIILKIETAKKKAKALGSAIFEAMLFIDEEPQKIERV